MCAKALTNGRPLLLPGCEGRLDFCTGRGTNPAVLTQAVRTALVQDKQVPGSQE